MGRRGGCLSLFMPWVMGIAVRDEIGGLLLLPGGIAVVSGWIALFGWNGAVVEPEASDRFRELAGASRPLPAAEIPRPPPGLE